MDEAIYILCVLRNNKSFLKNTYKALLTVFKSYVKILCRYRIGKM